MKLTPEGDIETVKPAIPESSLASAYYMIQAVPWLIVVVWMVRVLDHRDLYPEAHGIRGSALFGQPVETPLVPPLQSSHTNFGR